MKVAIVYDRVNKFGGAERVLLSLHEIFPKAHLFTSVYSKENAKWAKVFPKIHTSFLQRVPFAKTNHEFLPFLMPLAFSLFNFETYDLVITVTSEYAKNITVKNGKHICYLLTPTRYLWSHQNQYFDFQNTILKQALNILIIKWLKKIDLKAAKKPDVIISISHAVQKRVKKYYGRKSLVVYPPVNSKNFKFKNKQSLFLRNKNYYLVVSRLVKYKRVDFVIKAFNKLNLPLVIVGTGREERKLKAMANENIMFLGNVSDKKLASVYKNAKALIFPQEEDFGLVAVEAQSFGVPVVAYKKGGAIDTVTNKTGLFFNKQSINSLITVIKKFEKKKFNKKDLIKNAKRFSEKRFEKEFLKIVKEVC